MVYFEFLPSFLSSTGPRCRLSMAATFNFCDEEIRSQFIQLGLYGRLQHVMAVPPAYTTLRVNTLNGDVDDVLKEVRIELAKRHPGIAFSAQIHPIIKDLIVISSSVHGPIERTRMSKEVIVDRFCGMAVLRGSDVFAAGLLAMSPDIQLGDLVSLYVDIDSVCLRGALPPFQFNKYHLGNGVSKYSREEVYCGTPSLSGIGVNVTEPLYISPKLDNFLPRLVFPQNLPSCIAAHVLDPQPGEVVLDMCAAPGGKTCHIGSLMKGTGTLVAVDKAQKKMAALEDNLSASGCQFTRVYCYDSSSLVSPDAGRSLSDGPSFSPASFDRILLDAPCSALGQRPSLANPMSARELRSYPRLQRKLLAAAVGLLKDGGTLVYSTCTFNNAENEEQVSWLLKEYQEMSLAPQGRFHLSQSKDMEVRFPNSSLSDEELSLLQSFHPALCADRLSCDNDTIGFFLAKLTKKTELKFA